MRRDFVFTLSYLNPRFTTYRTACFCLFIGFDFIPDVFWNFCFWYFYAYVSLIDLIIVLTYCFFLIFDFYAVALQWLNIESVLKTY